MLDLPVLEFAPLSTFHGGATPMQAKWIQLGLSLCYIESIRIILMQVYTPSKAKPDDIRESRRLRSSMIQSNENSDPSATTTVGLPQDPAQTVTLKGNEKLLGATPQVIL